LLGCDLEIDEMAPPKSSRSAILKKWIKDLSAEEVYSIDGTIIFCQACQKNECKISKFSTKMY
jgi:hypothetical protein